MLQEDEAASDGSSVSFELEQDGATAASGCDEPPECAVCTDALWEAIVLPACGHTFCRHCVLELVRRSGSADSSVRCPLCREPLVPAVSCTSWLLNAPTDVALNRRLKDRWPETWERRRSEAALRAACSISLVIGSRLVARAGCMHGEPGGACRATPHVWSIFVEVVPPEDWRPLGGRDARAVASAMLLDGVRFTLPPSLTLERGVDNDPAARAILVEEDGTVDVQLAPFEVRCCGQAGAGASVSVPMQVDWKRRTGLPPLHFEHQLQPPAAGDGALASALVTITRHEVALPDGLTLARLLERARPRARVGAGTGMETGVF